MVSSHLQCPMNAGEVHDIAPPLVTPREDSGSDPAYTSSLSGDDSVPITSPLHFRGVSPWGWSLARHVACMT